MTAHTIATFMVRMGKNRSIEISFAGMLNLRKNLFSTDFDCLFQSTEFFCIYGRIYGFFLTRFGYYPPPLHFRDRGRTYRFFHAEFGYYPLPPPDLRLAVYRARRVNLFGCAE